MKIKMLRLNFTRTVPCPFSKDYIGYDNDQVHRHVGDNGFSFRDYAAIINLTHAKKRFNGLIWFDSGSQKLAMTIMHETGHPKFIRHPRSDKSYVTNSGYHYATVMGHVPYTIMDADFLPHYTHDDYMISVLQFLHGKLFTP